MEIATICVYDYCDTTVYVYYCIPCVVLNMYRVKSDRMIICLLVVGKYQFLKVHKMKPRVMHLYQCNIKKIILN